MNTICPTFPIDDSGAQGYWPDWQKGDVVVKARVTLFFDSRPFGVATSDYQLSETDEDGNRILTENDKTCIRDSMSTGIRAVAQSAVDPSQVVCAIGLHANSIPPRVALNGFVVEQQALPFTISSTGVLSALPCAGTLSLRNINTGTYYNDMEIAADEPVSLELLAGRYWASVFPHDMSYYSTEVTFEID